MNFRYAARYLAKTPGVTLVAALTLALGIGINTVVFALYESVAWKPLAVRAPEQMAPVTGTLAAPSLEVRQSLRICPRK
jgi:hypothetical protein